MNLFSGGFGCRREGDGARELASRVVASQFGDVCGEVVRYLLSRGGKSLREIEGAVGSASSARLALVVLWKHGLLSHLAPTYQVSCRNCCERLGLERFVEDVVDDDDVRGVVEYLVVKGVATTDELDKVEGFEKAARLGLIGPPTETPKDDTKKVIDSDELFEVEDDGRWTRERNAEAARKKFDKLWRLDVGELRRKRLRKVCVQIVEKKVNATARKVAETLFDLGAWRYESSGDEEGPPVLERWTLVEPRLKENGVTLSMIETRFKACFPEEVQVTSRLRSYLEYLRNDAANFVDIREGPGGSAYVFEAKHAVEDLRRRMTRHFLTVRYDEASARLHAVLEMHELIDQSDLAERALMPPKDAREKLYKMSQDGVVDLVDLASSAKGESHYLWRVDRRKTQAAILDAARTALRNLLLRKDHEEKTSAAQASSSPSQQQRQLRLDRLDKAIERLHDKEASLFQDPPTL